MTTEFRSPSGERYLLGGLRASGALLLLGASWLALAPTVSGAEKGKVYEVKPSVKPCLNMRQYPNTGATIVDCLAAGDPLRVVYTITGWVKGTSEDGVSGWLAEAYLQPSRKSLPEPASGQASPPAREPAAGADGDSDPGPVLKEASATEVAPTIMARRIVPEPSPAAAPPGPADPEAALAELRDHLGDVTRERDILAANLRRTKAEGETLRSEQAGLERRVEELQLAAAGPQDASVLIAALETDLKTVRAMAEAGARREAELRARVEELEEAAAQRRRQEASRREQEQRLRAGLEERDAALAAPAEPLPIVPDRAGDGAQPEDRPDIEQAIEAIFAWSKAWSQQSVDEYLSFYSDDFQPAHHETLAAWQEERRERLRRPASIDLSLSAVQAVFLDSERVSVRFQQRYRSGDFADTVIKAVVMRWEDGRWKFLEETVEAVVQEP